MAPVGELIWYERDGRIQTGVYIRATVRKLLGIKKNTGVRVSTTVWPMLSHLPERLSILHRHRIELAKVNGDIKAGPIYAILTVAYEGSFLGGRATFRDIIQIARRQQKFVYVLTVDEVGDHPMWRGHVRSQRGAWLSLPCPIPEAVYNRVPNRRLERMRAFVDARAWLRAHHIPLFNPEYFNKANIYAAVKGSTLAQYLPDTEVLGDLHQLDEMMHRHKAVYLKPAGGSIGQGMMRIQQVDERFRVTLLRNKATHSFIAQNMRQVWAVFHRNRMPGQYLVQAAVPLLQWRGRPCDFRILLQKHQNVWNMVGKGVRVSGSGAITTHVPNGGYIADAEAVIQTSFPESHAGIASHLELFTVQMATAIDELYRRELGEMSMDIGMDAAGELWFLEANSKPMKFDEPAIRKRSLLGIIQHLDELRAENTQKSVYQ